MQWIAHRGVHQNHPENTLGAFAAAVESGVPAVETDLRLTSDGQIVLFHDRLAGRHRVESLSHGRLTQVAGYRVPTLVEALDAFPQIHWILEIKTVSVLAPLQQVLRVLAGTHRLMVISFWHALILEAANEMEVDLGLSLGNSAIGFLDAAHAARARYPRINTIIWNYEFLDAEMLQLAQADAWRNYVFNTVSGEDDLRCRAMNVDGLITDRPEVCRPDDDRAPQAQGLP